MFQAVEKNLSITRNVQNRGAGGLHLNVLEVEGTTQSSVRGKSKDETAKKTVPR